jgi:hypothetical protein
MSAPALATVAAAAVTTAALTTVTAAAVAAAAAATAVITPRRGLREVPAGIGPRVRLAVGCRESARAIIDIDLAAVAQVLADAVGLPKVSLNARLLALCEHLVDFVEAQAAVFAPAPAAAAAAAAAAAVAAAVAAVSLAVAAVSLVAVAIVTAVVGPRKACGSVRG